MKYSKKIVHIMLEEKFIPPFIDVVNKNFEQSEHLFVIFGKRRNRFGILNYDNIVYIDKRRYLIKLLIYLYSAKKIIIHGLWFKHLNISMFLNPLLYKKSYWVMWGGDFYFPEKQTWLQKWTIKKVGYLITYIKGDYELAKKWYSSKGRYFECFMYPSNLYKEYKVKEIKHKGINIQVGNSSDPTNNHIEVLDKLKVYKDEDINIFAPLSYGGEKYAQKVAQYGRDIFGDKFHPMLDFMPFEEYLEFLGRIDIAIFAHNRQQAMGNTITLLGLGKKVYIRSDVTPWRFFEGIGVEVYDTDKITLDNIEYDTKTKNIQKIKEHFSHERYMQQLKKLFYEDTND